MKTAIVTGANGFVGSALLRELLKQDYFIYALDQEGHNTNIPNDTQVKFIAFDLSEQSKLTKDIPKIKDALFFHLAWAGSAGKGRADTELQLKNAQWTVDALRLSKMLGCKRFLAAGSIMERETIAAAYTQGNQPGANYIYGVAKLTARVMAMVVANEIGMEIVWPVITNAYGEGEISPRLVNTTIKKCLNRESPEFTSGVQNYDFVHIEDVARAFRLIGEHGKPFHEYIIGSSEPKQLREFLEEMQRAIAPDLPFNFGEIPFTGINLPLSSFDCSQTEQDTSFKAEINFTEGCKRTMNWWKEKVR